MLLTVLRTIENKRQNRNNEKMFVIKLPDDSKIADDEQVPNIDLKLY